jgi:hypothetical protein
LDQPLVVMPMPKHPRPAGRLSGPRRSRFKEPKVCPLPPEGVRRRQTADPTADNGGLGA